jgi:hypothetical protein
MKVKCGLFVLFSLVLSLLSGCGSGGAGLNGSVAVSATATGTTVTATATYTNPTTSNLIGVPITFSAQVGNQTLSLGTFNTNNSGSVSVSFKPQAFNGTQTITVIASTGNLTNFASLTMTGRSLAFTAPPSLNLTVSQASTPPATQAFTLPATSTFIAVTDPFVTDLSGLQFTITKVVTTDGNPATDTLTLNAATTATNTGGTASFPGAHGTITVPTTVGGATTMTISWTVTDPVTGLTGTGTTTVKLTLTA